jgi:hypothetical protein
MNGVSARTVPRSYEGDRATKSVLYRSLNIGGSWQGAAAHRGLQFGSRGLAIVRSCYQETTGEDTAGWKGQRDFVKYGNSDSVIVICS